MNIVKNLLSSENKFWKLILYEAMQINPQDLLRCNLDKKTISKLKLPCKIWYDVLKYWSEINVCKPTTSVEIENQFLWYNCFLKKVEFKQALYKAGIKQIIDIYNPHTREFHTYNELKENCNNLTFIDYYALMFNIPQSWKIKLNMNTGSQNLENNTLLDEISEKSKVLKWAYALFLRKIESEDPARTYWNNTLMVEIEENDWEKIRLDNYYATMSTKLRYFQYRLTSNRLTTKIQLFKWGCHK